MIRKKSYISFFSIAELSDKYCRENLSDEWEDRYRFIVTKSNLIPLPMEIAKNSGRTKWKLRGKSEDTGLMDAVIAENTSQHEFTVVTGEPHFEELKNVLFLK